MSEALLTFRCEACGASLTLPSNERSQICSYCTSPNVIEGTRSPGAVEPRFCIPHAKSERVAREALGDWQKGLGFFRHPGVRRARLEQFRGVYLPGLLYSAVARARYSASIAEEYYVTETYSVTVNGRSQTRTRQVKKHEWVPLSGQYDAYATDIVVSASRGIPNDELEAVEPFDFRALRRYSPGLVSGWAVETPTRDLAACLELARGELLSNVEERLARFMPGEMHSDLQCSSTLEHESAEPILVPVWVLALKYDEQKPALRVLVNSQTGKVAARVPWAWGRIVTAIVLALAAGAVIGWLVSQP